MKKYLLLCLLVIAFIPVFALQDSVIVPIYRQLFHDKINDEQIQLDRLDGKIDGLIRATHKLEINLAITDVMTRKIDEFENFVELNNKLATNNQKIRYLTYIENLLRAFKYSWRSKEFNPVYAPLLVETFEKIMKGNIDSVSMTAAIEQAPYEVGKILTEIFTENPGYAESKKQLYLKYSLLHPDKILQSIEPSANEPFADALVVKS